MAAPIITNRQLPDHAILDFYNKQTYLGNAYLVSTGFVASSTSETPLLMLSNPTSNSTQNGSGGSLGLFNIIRKLQNDTAGSGVIFSLYLNPTGVSGGTPTTPGNLRPGTGKTSKMTTTLDPTVTTKGTFIAAFSPDFIEIDSSVLLVLDPGYSLLVTVSAAQTSNSCLELSWYEI
jgi:hypothetical protein